MRAFNPSLIRWVDSARGLKITQDCILNELLTEENLFATLTIALYAADAIHNLVDVRPVIPHKGIASRRTLSLIRGLREHSSTMSTRRPTSASRSRSNPPGNHGGV